MHLQKTSDVGKTIVNHAIFYGLYHPFMVILGMDHYCFNHIILKSYSFTSGFYSFTFNRPNEETTKLLDFWACCHTKNRTAELLDMI
jgi:hypothetical protein